MTDQKPWCIWPYFNLSIRSNGTVGPCCTWDRNSLIRPDDLSDYINSDFFETIRRRHASGDIPDECRSCQEKDRIGSKSVRFLGEDIAADIGYDHTMGPTVLSHEVNISSICNIRCRTCDSYSSSKWIKDEKILNLPPQSQGKVQKSQWRMDEQTAKTMRRLEFVGGEPTLHQEDMLHALGLIARHGNISDMVIDITTNGMRPFCDELLELLLSCKLVHVNVSVDGLGMLNDYIRSDSKWDKVSTVLLDLDRLQASKRTPFHLHMVSVCSIYNINMLGELWLWAKDNLSVPSRHSGLVMLFGPTFMDSRMLMQPYKEIVSQRLLALTSLVPWHEPEVSSIVENLKTDLDDASERRQQFRGFNTAVDRLRGHRLQDVNPEMHGWLFDE